MQVSFKILTVAALFALASAQNDAGNNGGNSAGNDTNGGGDASGGNNSGAEASCPADLTCHDGTPCVEGDSDFSDHPTDINGVAFYFHEVTNKDGWHCECRDGLTGLRCNRPYERCANTEHVCYHGGKCIDGINSTVSSVQLFCDCTDAEHNGVAMFGKFCEIEAATQCGNTQIFCTNGGTCADGFETKAHPCDCQQGHRGPHCEFETGHVPNCTLQCDNGGTCNLGIKNYDTAIQNEFWARHDGRFQYCTCTEGWFGHQCDVKGEKCGENVCYNGAACLETQHSDGTVKHTCDCSAAKTSQKSYSGEFCENEASSYCLNGGDHNGNLFCVNGGTCKDNSHEGCTCPDGFHGPICEFRDSQNAAECRLQCKNGGSCRNGKKDNKLFEQFEDELRKFNETHRLWEHCVCPQGYFGIQCEHQLEICPGGGHVCLHGASCVSQNEAGGDDRHACNCDQANNGLEKYAGRYCQYTSTEICTNNGRPGVGRANLAFCVNNGRCKGKVNDNQDHPGCTCPDGFEGPHCEFLTALSVPSTSATSTGTSSSASTPDVQTEKISTNGGLVSGLAIAMLVLACFVGLVLLRKYMSSGVDLDTGKGDPMPEDAGADETVDMQSSAPTPSIGEKELQTVEII